MPRSKADIWGEARRHLTALINARERATQSAYRMMARLERREKGDEQAAMQWMTKAAEAMPDPVWLCRTCGGAHEEWQATCRHCHSFATLDWQSPGISRVQRTRGFQNSGVRLWRNHLPVNTTLAVFDFDHTLITGDSLWPFLAAVAGWPRALLALAEGVGLFALALYSK